MHGPINRPDYFDEYVVFQGASYFRAVGRGQLYGLSARGLAINTARPGGEEFPIFRAFWIEKPKPGARSIVIHALLDSVSTTGAYRFEVEPGEATIMDVEATLYPRRPLTHVGIAPLTSMYLHGPGHHRIDDDFRPAVHDSDGLAIYNGNSERIWRPLTNPKTLQTSAFVDRNLKGFGLCQRARSFHSFEDLEARYEKRPTLVDRAQGHLGPRLRRADRDPDRRGNPRQHRRLLEADQRTLDAGTPFQFGYRMYWTDDVAHRLERRLDGCDARRPRQGARARRCSSSTSPDRPCRACAKCPSPIVTANPGTVSNIVVHDNPETNGLRVSFELDPGGNRIVGVTFGAEARRSADLRDLALSMDEIMSDTYCGRTENRPHSRRQQPGRYCPPSVPLDMPDQDFTGARRCEAAPPSRLLGAARRRLHRRRHC